MELQVAGRGGSKRKYALADIKADIANKHLFVRKGLPPMGGISPTQPSHKGGDQDPLALTLALANTIMGSAILRRQRQYQKHQQHQQHRLAPRHPLEGGSRPQRFETGRWNPIRYFVRQGGSRALAPCSFCATSALF